MIVTEDQFNKVAIDHQNGLLVDRHGYIIHNTVRAENLFRCHIVGGLKGKTIHSLVPKSRQEQSIKEWEAYWADPRQRDLGNGDICWMQTLNGVVFPAEVSKIPWNTSVAGEMGIILIIVDFSERLRTLAEIQKKLDETKV